jgi:thiosulfate/3-mercaptopyruvate sulfurtransferase
MSTGPLISAEELLASMREPQTLLDARWELGGPPGHDGYVDGHIPGAAFVDLETELAAPPGDGGRHPLPDRDQFEQSMRRAGVSNARPVVVYGDASQFGAARAWWLLRYFGHPTVAVLDGGLTAWIDAGGKLEAGAPPIDAGEFTARPGGMRLLDAADAAALARRGILLDARAPERFRGEVEPIDPVAGRIPGARNRPTTDNVDQAGRLRDPAELRAAFNALGVSEGVEVGAYCGSGVTAAHEVLALELAGYPAALYVGSWSDWITDSDRPIERS